MLVTGHLGKWEIAAASVAARGVPIAAIVMRQVNYFGHPASTHRGPALFALRLGAPVFSCIARRLPGDDVRCEVIGEWVEFTPTGERDADVRSLTSELAGRLERAVRVAPEQYFWFHKRWKTQPTPAAI